MKKITTILFLFACIAASAQTPEQKVTAAMKDFHQALVKKDYDALNKQMDKALTYGHSNGWIQTQSDMVNDFVSGLITYHSIKEDSVKVGISGDAAYVRFIADINSTLRGNNSNNHIKVMEVYVKKGNDWVLFAIQAIR
jgi:ketosteroid isomerase-like protein